MRLPTPLTTRRRAWRRQGLLPHAEWDALRSVGHIAQVGIQESTTRARTAACMP